MSFTLHCSPSLKEGFAASYPECLAIHSLLKASGATFTTTCSTAYHPFLVCSGGSTVVGLEGVVRSYFSVTGIDGSIFSALCSNFIPLISLALVTAQRPAIVAARRKHCSLWGRFRHSLRQVHADMSLDRFLGSTDKWILPKFVAELEILEGVAATKDLSPTLRTVLQAVLSVIPLLPTPYSDALSKAPTLSSVVGAAPSPLVMSATATLYAVPETPAVDLYSPGRARVVVAGIVMLVTYWLSLNVSFSFEETADSTEVATADDVVVETVKKQEEAKSTTA